MKKFLKQFGLISAVIDALRRPPGTTAYPNSPVELPVSYRGEIVFNADLCTGCGLCVRDCPADALVLEKTSRDRYRLTYYPTRCAYCGQCEDNCRNKAIGSTHRLVEPVISHEGVIKILKDCLGD
jgi:formate hydrogenlyase subunit 6/NADH:ubiquinone oxidoreductase subunit I